MTRRAAGRIQRNKMVYSGAATGVGTGGNALWRQIRAEKKRSGYVFWTVVLLSLLYLAGALVFGDMGYLKLRTLRARSHALQAQVAGLRQEDAQMRTSMRDYRDDKFYQEKLAREDLGLAKKNEYIFIFNSPDR